MPHDTWASQCSHFVGKRRGTDTTVVGPSSRKDSRVRFNKSCCGRSVYNRKDHSLHSPGSYDRPRNLCETFIEAQLPNEERWMFRCAGILFLGEGSAPRPLFIARRCPAEADFVFASFLRPFFFHSSTSTIVSCHQDKTALTEFSIRLFSAALSKATVLGQLISRWPVDNYLLLIIFARSFLLARSILPNRHLSIHWLVSACLSNHCIIIESIARYVVGPAHLHQTPYTVPPRCVQRGCIESVSSRKAQQHTAPRTRTTKPLQIIEDLSYWLNQRSNCSRNF